MSGRGIALALCAMLAPAGPAAAACAVDETTVLACTARGGAKALAVCIAGDTIRYAYGPVSGVPELALTAAVADIEHQPWPGIGRAIWEITTFRNAGHGYEVALSVDRMAATPLPEGRVTVTRGDAVLAEVACDAGSVTIGLWAVSDAKQALGICWDPEHFGWKDCD